MLRQLTPRALQDYLGPEVAAPALITGTGAGVRALRAAATQLGKTYRWGAEGPSSFDCSGLTSFSFRQAGVTLPRSSCQQAPVGRPVSLNDLQPGDLVFFYNPVSHVGIYAGDGKMINAPQTGDVVRYSTVNRRRSRRPALVAPELVRSPLAGGGRAGRPAAARRCTGGLPGRDHRR